MTSQDRKAGEQEAACDFTPAGPGEWRCTTHGGALLVQRTEPNLCARHPAHPDYRAVLAEEAASELEGSADYHIGFTPWRPQ